MAEPEDVYNGFEVREFIDPEQEERPASKEEIFNAQINAGYTHEINFENVETIEDIVNIMKVMDLTFGKEIADILPEKLVKERVFNG